MTNVPILRDLIASDQIIGEDSLETDELRTMLQEAKQYLASFSWCRSVQREYLGIGVGGVVGVFLFQINAAAAVDDWLWVVVGDLPSAYLVTDQAATATDALHVYCDLMEQWVTAVQTGGDMSAVFPVEAQATQENAEALKTRIEFLRTTIIPAYS